MDCRDVFVVKYEGGGKDEEGQAGLSVHRDHCLMTFSILLNSAQNFEGGGTYFEAGGGKVIRIERGVGLFHCGKVAPTQTPFSLFCAKGAASLLTLLSTPSYFPQCLLTHSPLIINLS